MPVIIQDTVPTTQGACAPIASPALPPVAPNNLIKQLKADAAAPIDMQAESESQPDTSGDIPAELSAPTAAPLIISANSYSDQPPFPLSHARILYQSVTAGASVSATAGANPAFALTPNTWERWTFNGAQSLTITLPLNNPIDTVALGSVLAAGRSVLVEYDTTAGGTFVSFAAAQTNSESAMMFIRTDSVSVRRLRITVSGAGDGYIGVIYAGAALQMQRPIYGGVNPITLNRVTDYFNSRTESGQWIGRSIRRRGLESSLSFDRLTAPWYRQYFDPFVRSARTMPFFFAWRPDQYPAEVAYCWTENDIQPSNSGGATNHLSVSFNVKAHS